MSDNEDLLIKLDELSSKTYSKILKKGNDDEYFYFVGTIIYDYCRDGVIDIKLFIIKLSVMVYDLLHQLHADDVVSSTDKIFANTIYLSSKEDIEKVIKSWDDIIEKTWNEIIEDRFPLKELKLSNKEYLNNFFCDN